MNEQISSATHSGELKIGDMRVPCAFLAGGTRVLTETDFMENMWMYRSGALSVRRDTEERNARTPLNFAFKNIKRFFNKYLGDVRLAHVKYWTSKGNIAHGISPELIPKIREIWLDARKAGVLGPRQQQIADKADLVIRCLAHVGMVALVDEATGYP